MVKLDKHSSLVLAEVVGGPCKQRVILYCDSSREGPKDDGYEYHPLGAGGGRRNIHSEFDFQQKNINFPSTIV